jgi:hypothetical protein
MSSIALLYLHRYWQQFITYPVVNLMEVCTPMDGQSSLLLLASIKEDSVSGYVYKYVVCAAEQVPFLVNLAIFSSILPLRNSFFGTWPN